MANKKGGKDGKGCGYAGRIGNSGTQKVEALFPTAAAKGAKATTGSDLRAKKN